MPATDTLGAALREAGVTRVDAADGLPTVVDLLVETGLSKSKGDARRTIAEAVPTSTTCASRTPSAPAPVDLIGGAWLVLRRGKKNFAGVEVR